MSTGIQHIDSRPDYQIRADRHTRNCAIAAGAFLTISVVGGIAAAVILRAQGHPISSSFIPFASGLGLAAVGGGASIGLRYYIQHIDDRYNREEANHTDCLRYEETRLTQSIRQRKHFWSWIYLVLGANPDVKIKNLITNENQTWAHPIHLAVLNCDSKAVKLLLQFGAHPDVKDSSNLTALNLATLSAPSHGDLDVPTAIKNLDEIKKLLNLNK